MTVQELIDKLKDCPPDAVVEAEYMDYNSRDIGEHVDDIVSVHLTWSPIGNADFVVLEVDKTYARQNW